MSRRGKIWKHMFDEPTAPLPPDKAAHGDEDDVSRSEVEGAYQFLAGAPTVLRSHCRSFDPEPKHTCSFGGDARLDRFVPRGRADRNDLRCSAQGSEDQPAVQHVLVGDIQSE